MTTQAAQPSGELPYLIFGCGYLGNRVAQAWRDQGQRVIAVTRSQTRADEFAANGLIPFIADICDPASLAALPEVDRVLFAVGYDRGSGRSQEEVFVQGLRHVLDQLRGRCRRFVSISSTSVYGQSDGGWVDESSVCQPTQPGGMCCLAGEHLVREAAATFSDGATILRFAGIYGPNRLLSRIADLQAGRPLPGDSLAWLNLIHVDDGAATVIAAADASHIPPVVLVADDLPVQRGDYYAQLAELVGAPRPQFDPTEQRSRGSGGLNKRCSNRVLREQLGVRLRYPSYEAGLPAALSAS